jgi:hypothetical protein
MNRLHVFRQQLVPLKKALLEHPIYEHIHNIEALRVFMEHHVFAVWDFMSLLKELQRRLCCTTVPWVPSGQPLGSRLINEIVLAEESDDDGQGGFASHFEIYHRAMVGCGASTAAIDQFLEAIRSGDPVPSALEFAQVSESVGHFVRQTFSVIEEGSICAIASAFTFGREDLLPGLFRRVVGELNIQNGGLEGFRYYLDRHIGLDEEEHGPMASKLVTLLCGTNEDRWRDAQRAAVRALEARKDLWDGMLDAVLHPANTSPAKL